MSEPIANVVEQLVARHGSAAHVARIVGGVTARAVLRHASGERAPSPALAAKYVDLAAAAPAAAAPPAPSVVAAEAHVETSDVCDAPPGASVVAHVGPTRELLEDLFAKAKLVLDKALDDTNAAHRDRSAAIMATKNVLRDLARLRGELEITESMVLRSRAGRNVLDAVLRALKPFPDATAAVAKELEQIAGSEP